MAAVTGGAAGAGPAPEGSLLETMAAGPGSAPGPGRPGVFTTSANQILGTPAYMAPEQWKQEPCTGATDVWALGMILVELLTGRHLLLGKGYHQIYLAVVQDEPLPVPGLGALSLPEDLVDLVQRCLRKDPQERPPATEIVERLTERLQGAPRQEQATEVSPYRGLLPFGEQHADRFFGREAETAAVLERLRDEPLLPVVGPSGAGKSSFVMAGLVPRLREQGRWLVLQLRPGRQPFETLAARLSPSDTVSRSRASSLGRSGDHLRTEPGPGGGTERGPAVQALAAELLGAPTRLALRLTQLAEERGTRVLLFVDQLEELFTLVDEEPVRQAFARALLSAADDAEGPVRVIFTLRDDFLGRLAGSRWAREALDRVQVLGTPGPTGLVEILEKPIAQLGYRFEDAALVEEMIRSVAGQPAALPLLQFACQQLWEQRDTARKLLTRAAYQAIGGVAGALARQADAVLAGLPQEQMPLARALFLRLVTPEGTRRVVPRSELLRDLGDEAEAVLDRLTRERAILVRKGAAEAELELIHESLIRAWGQLVRWIEESREERVFLAEAGQAAALWEQRGRADDLLWRGEALRDAARRAERCGALPGPVQRFLEAGQRWEARRLRTRRGLGLAGLTLLVLAALASFAVSLALRQREQRARQSESRARSERRRAVSRGAEALREGARAAGQRGSFIEARAKLRGSLEAADSALARILWWRLSRQPELWRQHLGGIPFAVAFDPSGAQVAVANQDRVIYLFDVSTGAARMLRGHEEQALAVAFAPGGKLLASASRDGVVRIWDLGSGTARTLLGHRGAVRTVAFSPDGQLLASAGDDRTLRLWAVADGRTHAVLDGHEDQVRSVAFGPDGQLLASASHDRTVRLWQVASGASARVLRHHQDPVWKVQFSPDGRLLASGSSDRTVQLVDPASGQVKRVLRGHEKLVTTVGFSPDGRQLASAGDDQTIRLWQVDTGRLLDVLHGHRATVMDVGLGPGRAGAGSPAGPVLASAGYDRELRLWRLRRPAAGASGPEDPAGGDPAVGTGGHDDAVRGVSFTADGRSLVSASADRTVGIWSVETGRLEQRLEGHDGAVYRVDAHPSTRRIASASADGTIRLWEPGSGRPARVLRGHTATVTAVRFDPIGTSLVSASADGTARLWRADAGTAGPVLSGHQAVVWDAIFAPDGKLVATASADRTVRLWDATTGALRHTLRGHDDGVESVAFSADGRLLASASRDATVRIWTLGDAPTGRILGRHPGRVYSVAFDPRGEQVAAAGADGAIRLWSLASGGFRELRGHQGEVNQIAFRRDGELLASGSDDGTVRLWQMPAGLPLWRAPVLLPDTLELLTHRGWVELAPGAAPRPAPGGPGWRQALERHGRMADLDPDAGVLCLVTDEEKVQLWSRTGDRPITERPVARVERVVATASGCVTLASGQAALLARDGTSRPLASAVQALARDGRGLLVATDKAIERLDPNGQRLEQRPAGLGITAVARTGAFLVIGYRDGNLEVQPLDRSVRHRPVTFEDVPPSPVTRLIPGPMDTLVVGFASGMVGLWNLRDGTRLHHGQIHGPVTHLVLAGSRLVAASELGQHLVWDLDVFQVDHCALLRQVWAQVPVAWEEGLPVIRAAPSGHRCSAR
jgi:WD40 repeat protein